MISTHNIYTINTLLTHYLGLLSNIHNIAHWLDNILSVDTSSTCALNPLTTDMTETWVEKDSFSFPYDLLLINMTELDKVYCIFSTILTRLLSLFIDSNEVLSYQTTLYHTILFGECLSEFVNTA